MISSVKRLIILLVCFIAVISLCSCSGSSEPAADGAMTAVTSSDGTVTGYERRFHNENGDITRLDVYDADKVYQSFVLYDYDDYDRLLSETFYAADGIAQYRNVYSYDDDGNLAEMAVEHPHGEAEVTRYDSDGNETERLFYDTEEELYQRDVLEDGVWHSYDADGEPIDNG